MVPPLVLLAVLALCQVCPSWQMRQCGIGCTCESETKISCSFKSERPPSLADVLHLDNKPDIDRSKILVLYIYSSAGFAMTQTLTRRMLQPFPNLQRLQILRCNLTHIDSDAFADTRDLRYFDLSGNWIQTIPASLFSGLNIEFLSLDMNRGIRLNENSFEGSRIDKLILSKCNLTYFPLKSLTKVGNLKHLTLSSNQIHSVPKTALAFVLSLSSFYLDNNPLLCTCRNKWMRQSLDWSSLVSTENSKDLKLPTCADPFALKDIELTRVSPELFACSTPHIDGVRLLVDGSRARLECSAWLEEEEERDSLVWWAQPNSLGSLQTGTKLSTAFSRRSPVDTFVIGVRNSDGKNASVNLTVRWPEVQEVTPDESEESQTPPLVDSTKVVAGGGSGKPQADYFAQKQFTLVEMIVAVIGTFMATTLVFLLSCQFTRWYSRRDKKRWATYGSQPYSATYNPHQASTHEYDVPRIDQPCLSKAPPSAEFLDFNNPRVMYNV